jgi:hypothetical protein
VAIHYFKGAQKGRASRGVVWCGWVFSLAMGLWAFLGELVWFAPLLGRGNNLENTYYVRPK